MHSNFVLHSKAMYGLQRSKLNWIKSGDENTSFFHEVAQKRCKKVLVEYVWDGETLLLDQELIVEHFTNFVWGVVGQQDVFDIHCY